MGPLFLANASRIPIQDKPEGEKAFSRQGAKLAKMAASQTESCGPSHRDALTGLEMTATARKTELKNTQ
jgi:hypothetical protein